MMPMTMILLLLATQAASAYVTKCDTYSYMAGQCEPCSGNAGECFYVLAWTAATSEYYYALVACQKCTPNYFLQGGCYNYRDYDAYPCTVCDANSYIQSPCSCKQNTVCIPCDTVCPAGQYVVGCGNENRGTCYPCQNGVIPHSHYTHGCEWACDDGHVINAAKTACIPCPSGTYRSSLTACSQCPEPMSSQVACQQGWNYTLSNVDCSWTGKCERCDPKKLPAGYAWSFNSRLLPADIQGNCYSKPLSSVCSAGLYPCDPYCCECRNKPIGQAGVGLYYNTPGTNAYDCGIGRCNKCSVPGMKSRGCTWYDSDPNNNPYCVSCTEPLPVNAHWGDECAWVCNDGYYGSSSSLATACTLCTQSADARCNIGYYLPTCTNGVNNPAGCVPCTNKPQTQPMAVYSSSGTCDWYCKPDIANKIFYYRSSGDVCVICDPTGCPAGQYAYGDCFNPYVKNAHLPPTCSYCNNIENATLIGGGTMGNDANSCPFRCNSGFYAADTQERKCIPCTTDCGNGFEMISQCNYNSDAVCRACPNMLAPAASVLGGTVRVNYPVKNSCASFTCMGPIELVDGICQPCRQGTGKDSQSEISPCPPCTTGTYSDTSGSDCMAVPENAMTTDSTNTAVICNAGYSFSPQTYKCEPCNEIAQSSNVQWKTGECTALLLQCDAGYYNVTNDLLCSKCPDLSPNALQFTSGCAALCKPGFVPPDCNTPCAPTACGPGQVLKLCSGSSGGGSANTCVNCASPTPLGYGETWRVNRSDCSKICMQGKYRLASGTGCADCPAGTMTTAEGLPTACTSCSPGTYAPTPLGNTACIACPPGTATSVVKTSLACPICPAGKFSNQSRIVCINCPTGYISSSAGASACMPCTIDKPYTPDRMNCTIPPYSQGCRYPGFYKSPITALCAPCPNGAYCVGDGNVTLCPNAFFFFYSPAFSTSVTNCSANQHAAYSATNCGWPNMVARVASSAIKSTLQCVPAAGYYGEPGKTPSICPVDYYCPLNSIVPIPCEPNKPFSKEGAANSSMCLGYAPRPCRAGYYASNASAVACTKCMAGAYCLGEPSMPVACLLSSGGSKYYSPAGAKTANDCQTLTIAAGVTVVCPTNTQPASATTRFLCKSNAGYWYTPNSAAAAVRCSPGFYCPPQSLLPQPCDPPIADAAACAPGFTAVLNRCPLAGMAAPLSACAACPAAAMPSNAYYTANGTCDKCCLPGYYNASGLCTPILNWMTICNATSYVSVPQQACAIAQPPCLQCPRHQRGISVAYATAAQRANKTAARLFGLTSCSYACNMGYFGTDAVNGYCTECYPGKYKNFVGDASTCLTCPAGTYSNRLGATACLPCPRYSRASSDRTTCLCLPNMYMRPESDSIWRACVECPDGTFSEKEGALYACQPCPPGFLCVASPQRQNICPYGLVPNANNDGCVECGAGTYFASFDAGCVLCPGNAIGVGCAQSCPPGIDADASHQTCLCPAASTYWNPNTGACEPKITQCADYSLPLPDGQGCSPTECIPGFRRNKKRSCIPIECPIAAEEWQPSSQECICPENTYFSKQPAGASSCEPCATCDANSTQIGYYCRRGSMWDTSRCICNDGFVGNGITCYPCPVCDENTMYLSRPCDARQVQNRNSIRCICKLGYTAAAGKCIPCSSRCGPNTTVVPMCVITKMTDCPCARDIDYQCICQKGFIQLMANASSTTCLPCSAGCADPNAAISLQSCNAVGLGPLDVECTCNAGFLPAKGGYYLRCQPCPKCVDTNATQAAHCTADCICNAGFYANGGSNGLATRCDPCPKACADKNANLTDKCLTPGNQPRNFTCTCNLGYYSSAPSGVCARCPNCTDAINMRYVGPNNCACVCNAGYYRQQYSPNTCARCNQCNTYAYGRIYKPCTGTLQVDDTVCRCEPGYYYANSVCSLCPTNAFQGARVIGPCIDAIQNDNTKGQICECIPGFYTIRNCVCEYCSFCHSNFHMYVKQPCNITNNTVCGCVEGYFMGLEGYLPEFNLWMQGLRCYACLCKDPNAVITKTCPAGGTDPYFQVECECKQGYFSISPPGTKQPTCAACTQCDPNAQNMAPCLQGKAYKNSVSCVTCNDGYYGDPAIQCTPCPVCHPTLAIQIGYCTPMANTITCMCKEGFYGDGTTCTPCRIACPTNAVLHGTCFVGSPTDLTYCGCKQGFYGISEGYCLPCACDANATMIDMSQCDGTTTFDASVCTCNAGFYGNGRLCVPNTKKRYMIVSTSNYIAKVDLAKKDFVNIRGGYASGKIQDGLYAVFSFIYAMDAARDGSFVLVADYNAEGNTVLRLVNTSTGNVITIAGKKDFTSNNGAPYIDGVGASATMCAYILKIAPNNKYAVFMDYMWNRKLRFISMSTTAVASAPTPPINGGSLEETAFDFSSDSNLVFIAMLQTLFVYNQTQQTMTAVPMTPARGGSVFGFVIASNRFVYADPSALKTENVYTPYICYYYGPLPNSASNEWGWIYEGIQPPASPSYVRRVFINDIITATTKLPCIYRCYLHMTNTNVPACSGVASSPTSGVLIDPVAEGDDGIYVLDRSCALLWKYNPSTMEMDIAAGIPIRSAYNGGSFYGYPYKMAVIYLPPA